MLDDRTRASGNRGRRAVQIFLEDAFPPMDRSPSSHEPSPPRGEGPFLVVGAGRGGTSLLAVSLAGHSRLSVGMERFGVSCLMGRDPGLADDADLDIFASRTRAFREGCLGEIRRHAGRVWGNKITTEQLYGLEDHNTVHLPYVDVLDRFFREVVPEYRIVFIVRDGRACTASKVRRTGQTWEQAAFRWHYSVRVLKALRQLDRPVCEVRFEDLVNEPERVLRSVCGYLDVTFEPAMLQQTNSDTLRPDYRRATFESSRAQVPDLPAHVAAFLQPDLAYCGYA